MTLIMISYYGVASLCGVEGDDEYDCEGGETT
jgi:hypothetical protein